MTAQLVAIAREIAQELGPAATTRAPYRFAAPENGHLRTQTVSAAVFDSRTPSFWSALVALTEADTDSRELLLRDLGYLGAPLAILEDGDGLSAYEFKAPLVGEFVGAVPGTDVKGWLRSEILPRAEQFSQPRLPNMQAMDLVLGETTTSLRQVVVALLEDLALGESLEPRDVFGLAISLLRAWALDDASALKSLPPVVQRIAKAHRSRISFENIPLESVSELYESLATDHSLRRKQGLFYTPAWLARHLVGRLPSNALRSGPAIDPACGSGTFLVCFLERVVDDELRRDGGEVRSDLNLSAYVAGLDIDVVALETSRFTLDLLAKRLNLPAQSWVLEESDATESVRHATVLLGNLPFGYRSHDRRKDISTAILERWLLHSESPPAHISLLLPESLSFASSAADARRAIVSQYRIDEIIQLPENVFSDSNVATLGIIGTRAERESLVVVRSVSNDALDAFRLRGWAKSFTSVLPPAPSDPWVISPYYQYFASAMVAADSTLGDSFEVHVGLKAYGADPSLFEWTSDDPDRRLLDDPKLFLRWTPESWRELPRLLADPSQVHRPGPTTLFPRPKLLVRSFTNRHQRARLAVVWDTHGLWVTNKFTGIWARDSTIPISGLAAYLQTSFVELWVASNNPSRALRLSGLRELPVPRLPQHWWDRAAQLVPKDRPVVAPRWRTYGGQLGPKGVDDMDEWHWFESVVLAAFGIPANVQAEFDEYLQKYLTVGTYPSD